MSALDNIKEAAKNYALGQFPEEFGPGKKFISKEHLDAQCKPYRTIAEKHFIAGATWAIAQNAADPTKVTVTK